MMLRPRQTLLVERSLAALRQHGNTLAIGPTGCHTPGTPILMFNGAVKTVEAIGIGDFLMGPESTPRRVLEIHRGYDTMYEIRPIKGDPFRVNRGHVLTLVRTNEGDTKRRRNQDGELVDIPLIDYLSKSATFRHLHKLLRLPVDFPPQDPGPIDPYLLGILIGDGCLLHAVSVTTPDAEIVDALYAGVQAFDLHLRVAQLPGNEANTYHLVKNAGTANRLTEALRCLDLHGVGAGHKFLPSAYKLGDRATRLALLAGLLDTDGYLAPPGIFEFCSRSRQLADDVTFVARSLGFRGILSRKEVHGRLYWRVHLSGDCDQIPTRVVRKQAKPRRQKKNVLRTGFTVHEVGWGEYIGFTVDDDHRYLLGDFTVTHNSGKTLMLSAVAGRVLEASDAKACILAHRDELTSQNREKFSRVNPGLTTSVFDANEKSWCGQATFAMVQTLSHERHLKAIPALELLVIDETHHAAAASYRRVIDQVLAKKPSAKIFGVTATAARGDRQGLRAVFSNVADQITLGELIAAGHLVPPRTFVIDVGAQDALKRVRRTPADFDMTEVASILNKTPINETVICHWREKAGNRKTLVFCSTVAHAESMTEAFLAAGIRAVLIHGELSGAERKLRLADYETGDTQVVVNVAVLTEGYDSTPTACVVLLRPSSHKSTLIQMVGRGLRVVDPNEHPGVVKTDCIVLDFGTATLMHGSLEQAVNLDGEAGTGRAPSKDCPACLAIVPLGCRECPLCGFQWTGEPGKPAAPLDEFVMTEIDLLKRSNFRWCDLFGQDDALMATGFDAWGGVFALEGRWHALGGGKDRPLRLLAMGDRSVCLAKADDWLNENESLDTAYKTRRWLNEPPTERQLACLPPALRADFGLTRYQASALLAFQFNKTAIQRLVLAETDARRSAA